VAVFNIDGKFYATQADCTHEGGGLNEGVLEGEIVTCPVHGSCFNVRTGQVVRGPARFPIKTFSVTLDGPVARVEIPAA
jgi:3-phenylpropionate/trans-cinnamate dioxygenase ferredoxin subunit